MKISEIKGEAVFDVMARIAEPIVSIASDKTTMGMLDPTAINGADTSEKMMALVSNLVPKLMVDHREELIDIFAALNMQTREEYVDGLTMPKLIQDMYEAVTDKELFGFLPSGDETSK